MNETHAQSPPANALAAGVPPRTALGKLTAIMQTP